MPKLVGLPHTLEASAESSLVPNHKGGKLLAGEDHAALADQPSNIGL
jgi:hypothetical protein